MNQTKIDRINELARKARVTELTDTEKAEQKKLRAEYVAAFRNNLVSQLENTYIVDDKGNKKKVQRKKK